MAMRIARTELLEIAYLDEGPADGAPVLLLHGWPDDVRAWRGVAPQLHAAGWRTVTPYLRGFGPTRFRSERTIRDGRGIALAQDAIDLADALGLKTFAVVGHDWGARAAYFLAALFPERLMRIAALSVPFAPRGGFSVPRFSQARLYWYQWFMSVDGGADAVRRDPIAFARIQWDTWSPLGWVDEAEFAATARSFDNPDWVEITLSSYRSRWRPEQTDSRYDDLQRRLASVESLSIPTMMIHGGADTCVETASSEGLDRYFTGGYQRIVLDGIGHFPSREASEATADAIVRNLREQG
jgi:pimeloyl-ACP methyl ester carboxylesterase